MLESAVWRGGAGNGQGFSITAPVVNGTYDVYLWTIENYRANFRNMAVALQGQTAASGIGDLPLGSWVRNGPYRTLVNNGTMQIDVMRATKGDPAIMGLAIRDVSAPPGPNRAPTISFLNPSEGSHVGLPGRLTLSASASDPDGDPVQVAFSVGGNQIGVATSTPYDLDWQPPSAGTYSITATASDNRGGVSTAAVNVTADPPSQTGIGPLQLSANRRYLLDQNSNPFFWLGDTAWPLLTTYSCTDALAYLDDRFTKGFTVVQAVVTWPGPTIPGPIAPNCKGHLPFVGGNAATPNPAFFDHVDSLVRYANDRGIVMALTPLWGSLYANREVTTANARQYGRWLGTRYRAFPNIVWMNGGDASPFQQETLYRELAAGLQETDPNHLITFHPNYGGSSSRWLHQDSWLAFNMIQVWGFFDQINQTVARDLALSPAKPTIMSEGAYEEAGFAVYPSSPITPLKIRQQAYWSLLSGAAGLTYGHTNLWTQQGSLQSYFNSTGAIHMKKYRDIMGVRKWWKLVPDQTIFRSGAGFAFTLNVAARSSDGDELAAYFSGPSTASLDLAKVTAATAVRATWVDPRSGATLAAGDFATTAPVAFSTPAGWEDALLFVERTSGTPPPPPDPVPPVGGGGFLVGVNLGGPGVVVDGNTWQSWDAARQGGASLLNGSVWSGSYTFPVNPTPPAAVKAMLESTLWRGGTVDGQGFSVRIPVSNGARDVFLWIIENHQSNFRNMNVLLQGQPAAAKIGDLPRGSWVRYGPYRANVTQGVLTMDVLRASKGDPALMGVAIFDASGGSANQAPTVSLDSPRTGDTRSGPIDLTASANDPDGSVASVEFLNGTQVLGTATAAPYRFAWLNPPSGSQTVSARAIDNAGLSATSSTVTFTVAATPSGPGIGPIRISANKRHFVDQAGAPFFWMGDTGWPLFVHYTRTEALAYLDDRSAKGFTVVQAPLTWGFPKNSDGIGASPLPLPNTSGQYPFLNQNAATPNDAYFQNVDFLLQYAGQRGLVLALSPAWGSAHMGTSVKPENARIYGRWLGQRYAAYPNIVWFLGGDDDPTTKIDLYRELALGIREYDKNHLMTFHPMWRGSSSRWFQNEAWLDFHMIQTWSEMHFISYYTRGDLQKVPLRPVVLAEGAYEQCSSEVNVCPGYPNSPITPLKIRQQAYWSSLAGGFHSYGHTQLWSMKGNWLGALNSAGSGQMSIYKSIMTSLEWWKLLPDQSLFVSGAGADPNFPQQLSSLSSDGTFAAVYLIGSTGVSLNLSRLTAGGTQVQATWMNPETGASMPAGTYGKVPSTPFQMPAGWADALLLLRSN
jgi:hypothetical protein